MCYCELEPKLKTVAEWMCKHTLKHCIVFRTLECPERNGASFQLFVGFISLLFKVQEKLLLFRDI